MDVLIPTWLFYGDDLISGDSADHSSLFIYENPGCVIRRPSLKDNTFEFEKDVPKVSQPSVRPIRPLDYVKVNI